jgi:hypothetical protein
VSIDCMVERGLFLRDDTKNRMLVLAWPPVFTKTHIWKQIAILSKIIFGLFLFTAIQFKFSNINPYSFTQFANWDSDQILMTTNAKVLLISWWKSDLITSWAPVTPVTPMTLVTPLPIRPNRNISVYCHIQSNCFVSFCLVI